MSQGRKSLCVRYIDTVSGENLQCVASLWTKDAALRPTMNYGPIDRHFTHKCRNKNTCYVQSLTPSACNTAASNQFGSNTPFGM